MSLCGATRVYAGHSNPMMLVPYTDVVAKDLMDLSGVTEVRMCVGGIEVSSVTDADLFSWSETPADSGRWVITLRPGLIPGVINGPSTLRVIVYDGDHLEGLVIADGIEIEVVAACAS